ncbi:hypothetical protein [Phreatobacter sp.]|uniref:hypothetical protein n=1 Tax=Phreatobacter sp. TaxID=1966341 RepID=UPI003F6EF549
MNRYGFYLVRLLRIGAGFFLALAVAAAMVLVLDLNRGRLPEWLVGVLLAGYIAFHAAAWLWPLLIAAFAAEIFRWRSLAFSLGLGLAGAAAVLGWLVWNARAEEPDPLLGEDPAFSARRLIVYLAAGLVGGLIHWLVAGRSAGLSPDERTDP